jgi:hypothetical protein
MTVSKHTRKARTLTAGGRYDRLGLWTLLIELLERRGFTKAEIAAIRDIVASRWSQAGDLAGNSEQLRRTLEGWSSDPRIAAVIDEVGDGDWDAQLRAAHRIVPITFGDIFDVGDLYEGGSKEAPPAGTVIGYLLIRGDLMVIRIGWSGSLAGAIYDRRGEPTNLATELLVQLMKVVRFCQLDGSGQGWSGKTLALKFSGDFTRSGRLALEHARMRRWLSELRCEFWLGMDKQPEGRFAELIASLQAADAESKGADGADRTTKGIIDHLAVAEREPRTENHTLPWRRHGKDADAIDGRARVAVGNGTAIIGEWDVAVVPAARAWIRTVATHRGRRLDGSLRNELALLLVAHEVPTVPAYTTNHLRNWTFADLLHPAGAKGLRQQKVKQVPTGRVWGAEPLEARWSICVSRADDWLVKHVKNHGHRLEPLPDVGDPTRGPAERRNAARIAALEAARTGVETVRFSLPKTAPAHLETYGAAHHRVIRDREQDRGYVVLPRFHGFPPKWSLKTEVREVVVPRGIFKGRERVRDASTSVVTIEIEVLDQPVFGADGEPEEWEHLGLGEQLFEQLYAKLTGASTDTPRPPTNRILDGLSGYDDGQFQFRLSPEGVASSRLHAVWHRPVEQAVTSTGHPVDWPNLRKLKHAEVTDPDGTVRKVQLWNGADISDQRLGVVQDALLLKGAAGQLEQAVTAALGGEVVLNLPLVAQNDERAIEVRREQLLAAADQADAEAVQHAQDAEGQELLAGRRLAEGDEDGVARLERRVTELTAKAEAAKTRASKMRRQADELEQETVEDHTTIDLRQLAALVKAIEKVADAGGDAPEEQAGTLQMIVSRIFTDWRVLPATGGGFDVTCTARIQTVGGEQLEAPLAFWCPNTAYGVGSSGGADAESVAVLRRVMRGELSVDEAVSEFSRPTSRRPVVKRLRPALQKRGVAKRLSTTLLDHPFDVARAAVWTLATDDAFSRVEWSPATKPGEPSYLDLMRATYFQPQGHTASVACPTDVTPIQMVAACLAQHPEGVELAELATKTGVTETRIRQMVTGQRKTKEFAGRPSYFRWIDPGMVVGLYPCENPRCPKPGSFASVVCLLPETYRPSDQPGAAQRPGGVLCQECATLVGFPHSPFPHAYVETLVTGLRGGGKAGCPGSVETQQVTLPSQLPPIPTVKPFEWMRTSHLEREFPTLARHVIQHRLEEAGVPRENRNRGADRKPVELWHAATARLVLTTAVQTYRELAAADSTTRPCQVAGCANPARPRTAGRPPSYCEDHATARLRQAPAA